MNTFVNMPLSTAKENLTDSEKDCPKSNLERIKVPEFSGDIKSYRTWKRIFIDTMKKNHEDITNLRD